MRSLVIGIATVFVLTTAACAAKYEDAEMQPIASNVTKLAAKLDAYVFSNPAAENMTEEQLKNELVARDPELMASLAGYMVRVHAVSADSSVLVCTANGVHALIEDAGCSAASDLQYWHTDREAPCEFALDLKKLCAAP